MEWKISRKGRPPAEFSSHDLGWLKSFTKDSPTSLGYLVQLYCVEGGERTVKWAKVANGEVFEPNRRS